MTHGIQDEELTNRRTQSKLDCKPQTPSVGNKKGHSRNKFFQEDGSYERDKDSIHIEHLLKPKRRWLESRNNYILLHSTYTIHTQGEKEKNQPKCTVRCRIVLFGFGKELKNYSRPNSHAIPTIPAVIRKTEMYF